MLYINLNFKALFLKLSALLSALFLVLILTPFLKAVGIYSDSSMVMIWGMLLIPLTSLQTLALFSGHYRKAIFSSCGKISFALSSAFVATYSIIGIGALIILQFFYV